MSNYKVAVKNDLLIPNVEFQELAAAISKLAEYNGHLSDFEKSSALDIIDSWEKNIIRDLKNKEREFYNFIQCFPFIIIINHFYYLLFFHTHITV